MRGFRGGEGVRTPPPERSQKYRISHRYAPDPLKSERYQASIQCWAIIGTPAKRLLSGVSLVGR